MPLTAGTRLGAYEVTAQLGAGGMGEVYRARDTKLDRDVAIRILPDRFVADLERVARFQREAKTLASLNHPNIAHIHGLEESNGVLALVMELVEGEDLSQRIARGPIPIDEALPIAKQIAEALEAAHEQGIIHRDLKPANIKVRLDGTVKVLDFGLAKAMEPVGSVPNVSQSPTITTPAMTAAGVILGTAAYMSPEQARGRPADKRSDVWSFGAVLYEMLTGRRPFAADDVSDTLAAVLLKQPDWNGVPPKALRLLRHCLEKDPRKRLQAIGDARLLLDDASAEPAVHSGQIAVRSRQLPWALAVVAMLAFGTLALLHFREAPPAAPDVRLSVPVPTESTISSLALSPNGRRLAIALIGDGLRQLWLRDLDSQQLHLLPGTVTAQYPFWSPDSRWIGFFADGKLKSVSASGGPPQVLCDADSGAGGTWNRDGVILFAAETGPVQRVPATGGACTTATTTQNGINHRFPEFLPDGRHFFYLVAGGDESHDGVYVTALDTLGGERRVLADQSSVAFVPRTSGNTKDHLLFVRRTTLLAQPFDAATLQVVGDAFPVVDQASFSVTGRLRQMAVSASATGVLAYLANLTTDSQLAWVDRSGKELATVIPSGAQRSIGLSPDGKIVAFSGPDGLVLRDLIRGVDTRFTFPPLVGTAPVWSPDSTRLVFSHANTLYVKDANGSAQETPLFENANTKNPTDWSSDARFLLYTETDPKTGTDLWVLPDPLSQIRNRRPTKFLSTEFNESSGQFSPDGRWLAYVSDESGQPEVYVRPFPPASGKWKVSTNRAIQPRWRRDGKELYYMEGGALFRWMAVPVTSGRSGIFDTGEPMSLFLRRVAINPSADVFAYNPDADGRRFLVNTRIASNPTLNVITNWEKASARPLEEP